MPVEKFRFVSPGIQTAEIDRTARAEPAPRIGPVIIGRARSGPGMVPVRVQTREDLIKIFGDPVPGAGGGDVWREGSTTAPTYGMYAADAFMRNSGPLTYVRLLGENSDNASSAAGASAGWNVENAYGLFLFDAVSSSASTNAATGSLSAVFYTVSQSAGAPSVTVLSSSYNASNALIGAEAGSNSLEFKVAISNYKGDTTSALTATINFDRNSDKYIRKVLNTNPEFTNSEYYADSRRLNYWVGETYESSVSDTFGGLSTTDNTTFAATAILAQGTNKHSNRQYEANKARTGYIVHQDLENAASYDPLSLTKLFRFESLHNRGVWDTQNIKISIVDIKPSANPQSDPYGTFSVLIRSAADTDKNPVIYEQYNGLNLNPKSENYIARKIGDKYRTWVEADRRYTEKGIYPNVSAYVRVDVSNEVAEGTNPEYLPFGYYGPVKYHDFIAQGVSGSGTSTFSTAVNYLTSSYTTAAVAERAGANMTYAFTGSGAAFFGYTASAGSTYNGVDLVNWAGQLKVLYPAAPLRSNSTYVAFRENAYFGVNSLGIYTNKDKGYVDYHRLLANNVGSDPTASPSDGTAYSYIFTLDDLVQTTGSTSVTADTVVPMTASGHFNLNVAYVSGSRVAEKSVTKLGYAATAGTLSDAGAYRAILDAGYDQFTMPMVGGFDGFNIVNPEPFANKLIGSSETDDYAYFSLRKAIDTIRDPEVVEHNLVSIPGVVDTGITNLLIDMADDRRDTLAVIDIESDYQPRFELGTNVTDRETEPNVDTAVSSLKSRQLNSSYAACFYPYVQIVDRRTNLALFVPPSVAAIASMGYTDRVAAPWFAPAGFVRGGLSTGVTGLTVIGVSRVLRQRDRDKLYEQNINPIAQFPAEGVVVFGQKTLQATPSALDRINVRRLLIYVKKEISRIANSILFEQNVEATWNRFKSRAVPFLDSVKAGLGLEDFRFILDESTTTPDLVDRNILYARVLLKPAKAIEFIALDFEIFKSGASFDD